MFSINLLCSYARLQILAYMVCYCSRRDKLYFIRQGALLDEPYLDTFVLVRRLVLREDSLCQLVIHEYLVLI